MVAGQLIEALQDPRLRAYPAATLRALAQCEGWLRATATPPPGQPAADAGY